MYPYGSKDPLTTMGNFTATAEIGDRKTEAEFLVIEGRGHSILSRETAETL